VRFETLSLDAIDFLHEECNLTSDNPLSYCILFREAELPLCIKKKFSKIFNAGASS